MDADRVVTQLPLSTLWDDNGSDLMARRGPPLGANDIRDLLRREERLSFVIAEVGSPLRRVAGDARFSVWKDEVAPHLVDPSKEEIDLDSFPDGHAYLATEWRAEDGTPVVVIETHH